MPATHREIDLRFTELHRYLDVKFKAVDEARFLAAEKLDVRLRAMDTERELLTARMDRQAVAQSRLQGRDLGILGLVAAVVGSIGAALIGFLK